MCLDESDVNVVKVVRKRGEIIFNAMRAVLMTESTAGKQVEKMKGRVQKQNCCSRRQLDYFWLFLNTFHLSTKRLFQFLQFFFNF